MGNEKMCYTLMHREVPVAEIVLNPENGWVQKTGEVYNEAHVPVGVAVKKVARQRDSCQPRRLLWSAGELWRCHDRAFGGAVLWSQFV